MFGFFFVEVFLHCVSMSCLGLVLPILWWVLQRKRLSVLVWFVFLSWKSRREALGGHVIFMLCNYASLFVLSCYCARGCLVWSCGGIDIVELREGLGYAVLRQGFIIIFMFLFFMWKFRYLCMLKIFAMNIGFLELLLHGIWSYYLSTIAWHCLLQKNKQTSFSKYNSRVVCLNDIFKVQKSPMATLIYKAFHNLCLNDVLLKL